MDAQSPKKNEALLHQFVNQEDPHVVGMVGIQALAVLAREMKAEEFEQFISQNVEEAASQVQQLQEQSQTGGAST